MFSRELWAEHLLETKSNEHKCNLPFLNDLPNHSCNNFFFKLDQQDFKHKLRQNSTSTMFHHQNLRTNTLYMATSYMGEFLKTFSKLNMLKLLKYHKIEYLETPKIMTKQTDT